MASSLAGSWQPQSALGVRALYGRVQPVDATGKARGYPGFDVRQGALQARLLPHATYTFV